MSAPLKIKIYYMSAQQNMGENLVFIPHQILIFDVEIFGGALRKFAAASSRLWKFWGSSEEIRSLAEEDNFVGATSVENSVEQAELG